MNAILDVYYVQDVAVAGCILFDEWTDSRPRDAVTERLAIPATYRPGRFYERELPCLLAVLKKADRRFEYIVVDGFVHLKPPLVNGLGAHLAKAMGHASTIIGVAKNPLRVADRYAAITRGRSRKPLFISSENCPVEKAARLIRSMHGPFRIPTLIKQADKLCRGAFRP